jgi:hypothetical protein
MSPLLLVSMSSVSHAYELEASAFGFVHINGGVLNLEMHGPSLLAADASGLADSVGMADAASRWSSTGAAIDVNVFTGSTGYGWPNFSSEIARDCSASLVPAGAPAVTLLTFDYLTGFITEADVYVCGTTIRHTTTKSAMTAYGGTTRPLVPVMLHEFGHAVGLQHENDVYNIMGQEWDFLVTNDNNVRPQVGADAGAGAIALYGTQSVGDASVSHFRWSGRSGEYSTHDRTRVLDPMGRPRPFETVGSEPVYLVWPETESEVEWTLENNGSSSGTISLEPVFSTNNNATTSDPTAGSIHVFASDPGLVLTTTVPMSVPAGTAPGSYWFGAVIDASHSDYTAYNDQTYTGIRVVDTWNACSSTDRCGPHEGDCDSDAECATGTTCVSNVGADYGQASSLDVCQPSVASFCTPSFPCLTGEGDCDSSADCLSGVCSNVFLPAPTDVCL